MPKALVIVESPAKAKTIEKFLGKSHYTVKASVGHVRDLPKSRLGVKIDEDFEPEYINIRGKGDIIKALKKEAKKAKKVYLATDPDREGEAISWHLSYILGIDLDEECRIEFNEITKDTIKKSIKHPRKINQNLVDAQQARRVLDRLLGYQISPVLWQKIRRGLSAGRVQSVTTKIICDRENEIKAFVPKEYWTLSLEAQKNESIIEFDYHGKNKEKDELENRETVDDIVKAIEGEKLLIDSIETKSRKRNPISPFTTSSMQQDAVNKLGFSTKKTMKIAQELYEGIDIEGEGTVGLISYIRTDSQRISDEAKALAKEFIMENYGEEYYGGQVRKSSGGKGKQDAHEAIRPTSVGRIPKEIKSSLSEDQYKLYNLIWRRFLGSQMSPSRYETLTIDAKIKEYDFRATGSKQVFDGYTRVYHFTEREDRILPPLNTGEKLDVSKIKPEQHFTQPPARYTEASLVKTLEELGIGRPSTYAPTIATILNREYVEREGSSIKPTELGQLVTNLLEENFEMLTDVDYTARLESRLDDIADGEVKWKTVIREAYEPLESSIKEAIENIEKVNMDVETDEKCELCGANMVIKYGRFGKFMACKNYPECKNTKPIMKKIGVKCPLCKDGDIVERKSRKKRTFYGCSNYPECNYVSWRKPTGEICKECGFPMVEKVTKKETVHVCSNKDCITNQKAEAETENFEAVAENAGIGTEK